MALVIEDGSGALANANSYDDLAFIREFNEARGRQLSDDDEVVTQQAILAMDYIEAQEWRMIGERVFGLEQPLSWPRSGVYVGNEMFPIDAIPVTLKNAQAELVWQIKSGTVLFPTFQGQAVKRRKVGPMEREFFAPGGLPDIPAVDNWLNALYNNSLTQSFLRVDRV